MRLIGAILVLLLIVPSVFAISIDAKTSYQPKETMIAEIGGQILNPIGFDQVRVKRENVVVPVDYGVGQLDGRQYLWIIVPSNRNNYTLIVNDIYVMQSGIATFVDLEHDFVVEGNTIAYSIKPGIASSQTSTTFEMALHEDFSQSINLDFPESQSILLNPGSNSIEIGVGNREAGFYIAGVGTYLVPYQVIASPAVCGNGIVETGEACEINENCDGGEACSGCSCILVEVNETENNETNVTMNETNNETVNITTNETNVTMNETMNMTNVTINESLQEIIEVAPGEIDSVILLSDIPIYSFTITNNGEEEISNLIFDYDTQIVRVEPDIVETLGVGEEREFQLQLLRTDDPIDEIIVARSGGFVAQLPLRISYTEDENEVNIPPETRASTRGFYCSEIGEVCEVDETCNGIIKTSIDQPICCSGTCAKPQKTNTTGKVIGYTLGGIVVLVLLFVFLRYRKAKTDGGGGIFKRST